jgi:hypothetical protein
VIAVLLLLLFITFLVNKKKKTVAKQIESALSPYFQTDVKNIIFPDGIGGLVEIEQLVLLKQGFLIIETYPISGNIFGANNIDKWTQMVDGKSFKFTNPLYRVQMLRQAIQVVAPNTPIFYCIIFTAKDSTFPKGKPEYVSTLLSLKDDLIKMDALPEMTEKQRSNWQRILRIARKDGKPVLEGDRDG